MPDRLSAKGKNGLSKGNTTVPVFHPVYRESLRDRQDGIILMKEKMEFEYREMDFSLKRVLSGVF